MGFGPVVRKRQLRLRWSSDDAHGRELALGQDHHTRIVAEGYEVWVGGYRQGDDVFLAFDDEGRVAAPFPSGHDLLTVPIARAADDTFAETAKSCLEDLLEPAV